jgi:pimeloyl-ACP methyl ester carboxylesterase
VLKVSPNDWGRDKLLEAQSQGIDTGSVGRKRASLLHFSSSGLPLYGAFHSAESSGHNDRVLVFCHSLGSEHLVTQRMETLGARIAANTGFPAFRYHSRSHGDSAGDPEGLTFADLIDDACAAADYARELSGASQIIWVGVRFGCLIAAAALARRDDAAALALWEPLHQGGDYFRAALRAAAFCQIAEGKRPAGADELLKRLKTGAALPVVGTYIYRALYHGAQDADLSQILRSWSGGTLIAQVQNRPRLSAQNERLRTEIHGRGGKVTVSMIRQEPAWSMLPFSHPQWSSETLLTSTKEWLRELD